EAAATPGVAAARIVNRKIALLFTITSSVSNSHVNSRLKLGGGKASRVGGFVQVHSHTPHLLGTVARTVTRHRIQRVADRQSVRNDIRAISNPFETGSARVVEIIRSYRVGQAAATGNAKRGRFG